MSHSPWVALETQCLTPHGSLWKLSVSLPMGRSGNSVSHSPWVVRSNSASHSPWVVRSNSASHSPWVVRQVAFELSFTEDLS
ncbi:hypothetical protein Q2296_07615 [Leptospira kirschneri]